MKRKKRIQVGDPERRIGKRGKYDRAAWCQEQKPVRNLLCKNRQLKKIKKKKSNSFFILSDFILAAK
jgi:hypothetical protein